MKTSIKDKVNRVFLTVFIVSGILLTLFQVLLINSLVSSRIEDAETLLLSIITSENNSLINEIYESRTESLKLRAEKIAKTRGIMAVRIYDNEGRLLVSSEDTVDEKKLNLVFPGEMRSVQAEYYGKDSIDFIHELKVIGEQIGFIRIFYSLENVKKYRFYSLIIIFIVLSITMIAVPYILNKKIKNTIISPIMQLNAAMQKTNRVITDLPVLSHSDDEIGDLIKSFNEMTERIYDTVTDYEIIIDEYRNISEAFRKSEEDLRITLNSIADGVISTDIDGKIIRFNKAASEITGYDESDVIGKSLYKIFSSDDMFFTSIDEVTRKLNQITKRVSLINKYNKEIFISVNSSEIKDDSGVTVGAVIVFSDITTKLLTEEKLRQSQKMDALGQLAGGVAHDFNNMLSAITGSAELMNYSINEKKKLVKYIDLIISTCLKASKLTWRLLTFSRQGNVKIETVDVFASIKATVQLLKRSIDKRIEIKTELPENELYCLFDNAQLENVLLNLGLNAKDAMPEGGILKYSAGIVDLDNEFCSSSGFDTAPGKYIEISCSDTGCGMTDEILHKIFEPFFTTKEPGKGTGLGLASVYGIIKDYKGIIKVISTPGSGTVFKIYIPASDKTHNEEKHEYIFKTISSKTVLLADDEKNVHKVLKIMLEKLGHNVFSAYSGNEAVDQFREHREKIDLIILDLMMPGLNGREVYYRMSEINPDFKVIVSSGFSKDDNLNVLLQEKNVYGFLQKPYSFNELKKVFNEIFDHGK
jgi:PAS domain S-box-containing protein